MEAAILVRLSKNQSSFVQLQMAAHYGSCNFRRDQKLYFDFLWDASKAHNRTQLRH